MLSDLRFGLRQLLKSPGFTLVALLTLALGIGVNTTMFTVLNALVLQSSPAPDSGRLVVRVPAHVAPTRTLAPFARQLLRYPEAGDLLPAAGRRFTGTTTTWPSRASRPSACRRHDGLRGILPVYGIAPLLGHSSGPTTTGRAPAEVAVLSDGFGAAISRPIPASSAGTVRMDGQPVTIIGVMPPKILTSPSTGDTSTSGSRSPSTGPPGRSATTTSCRSWGACSPA